MTTIRNFMELVLAISFFFVIVNTLLFVLLRRAPKGADVDA